MSTTAPKQPIGSATWLDHLLSLNPGNLIAVPCDDGTEELFDTSEMARAELAALRDELARIRTIAWRLGRLDTLDTVECDGEPLVSDLSFIPLSDLAAHNAIVDAVRAEQGGEEGK